MVIRWVKCEDREVTQGWFDRVRQVIVQYGIISEDIFNFDEIGSAMGLAVNSKVISRAEYYGRKASS